MNPSIQLEAFDISKADSLLDRGKRDAQRRKVVRDQEDRNAHRNQRQHRAAIDAVARSPRGFSRCAHR